MTKLVWMAAFILGSGLLGACAEMVEPDNPSGGMESVRVSASIESAQPPGPEPNKWACTDPENPNCLPESSDDPDPSAPGIFLGTSWTMDLCRDSNDLDLDGLHDNCEYLLAAAFSPLLATSPNDQDLTRETYWAAAYRPANWDGNGLAEHVEVLYLIGYHWDASHQGDSEFIKHRIFFDAQTLHWKLYLTFLSAHWNEPFVSDSSEEPIYWQMTFPVKSQGYPRVWVAKNKHANYKSRRACNAGSILGFDTCEDNVDGERLQILQSRDIGSNLRRNFEDGVGSVDSGLTGIEHFWTEGIEFCGWTDRGIPNLTCSRPYEEVLTAFFFKYPIY